MKVKIEITKIFCKRTTRELSKDEIYFALLVIGGKLTPEGFAPASKNPITTALSEIETKVKRNKGWIPIPNEIDIDLGDATAFAINFALYERDNAEVYDKLKEGFNEILTPEIFDWKSTLKDLKLLLVQDINENEELDFTDISHAIANKPQLTPVIIGEFLLGVIKRLFKRLRQDDLLGVKSDVFHVEDPNLALPREYSFDNYRGKYDVGIKVTRIG